MVVKNSIYVQQVSLLQTDAFFHVFGRLVTEELGFGNFNAADGGNVIAGKQNFARNHNYCGVDIKYCILTI